MYLRDGNLDADLVDLARDLEGKQRATVGSQCTPLSTHKSVSVEPFPTPRFRGLGLLKLNPLCSSPGSSFFFFSLSSFYFDWLEFGMERPFVGPCAV